LKTIAEPELAVLAQQARKVLGAQLLVTVLVAALFLLQGTWASVSALYGGLASVIIALLLRRGIRRASQLALENPKKSMTILYVGAVQRFVLVLVLLALGLAGLKLDPVAVCVGFAVAQVGYLANSRANVKRTNADHLKQEHLQ
jgi:ATP synthase protein I